MAISLPRLKLKNFNPTPELMKIVKRSLDRLTDLSPSDSYVKTVLEQNAAGTGYSCEISINSTQKSFNVLKVGAKPAEVLLDAVGSLLNDLTSWKKIRFK